MQILKITNVKGILLNGSSKPLLISAINSDDKELFFVMKTYKKKYNEENFTIAKEIIISELAKKFDLNVPDYGLVKISDEMLSEHYTQEEINDFDNGYKFCSEFKEGALDADSDVNKKFLDNYDYSKLFAFDHLIMNSDRGGFNLKPNLLYTDKEMILIDHERSMPFYSAYSYEESKFFNLFNLFYCKNHLFWKNISNLNSNTKKHIFDEFIEILRNMNFDFLNFVFEDLKKHNINYGDKDVILTYLYWAKSNSAKLQNILNQKV